MTVSCFPRVARILSTGSYNIDIGNQGVASESNTTRIEDSDRTRTFISGIRGVTTGSANAVAMASWEP